MHSKVDQLHSRAASLAAEFERRGERRYIDEAVKLDRERLKRCPRGHPMRAVSLDWLSHHLFDRYKQLWATVDLEEAIVLCREALTFRPPGHSHRSTSLNDLANYLSHRYKRLGATADLEQAIVVCRESMALRPPGHPRRSTSLSNLAIYLSDRYRQLGGMMDLDEAIVLCREALALCPPGHPHRPTPLNNLTSYLSDRYKQLGAIVDLSELLVLCREALALRPPGHPHRSTILNNLARYLFDRYKQLGAITDIEEAIPLCREALSLRPRGHPSRCRPLSDLALYFCNRYYHFGTMVDLQEAIVLCREALALHLPGHPNRSMSLNNLAGCLSDRYNQLGAILDLQEAIVLCREALSLRPPGHTRRSVSLKNLANLLSARFTRTKQLKDQEEIFSLYAQVPQMVSSTCLSASRAWIHVAERFQHPTTLLAYETSLRLLIRHLATLPSSPRHLKVVKNITLSLATEAFSSCLRNRSPAKAVEFLEQGCSVFWSQLARLRSPLDAIAPSTEGKILADKFRQLTSLIRNALDSQGVDHHDRVWHLNVELQQVESNIRKLPGFSRFLLPLPFSDLQQAAVGGPVIIVNASKYGCDALIVLLDRDPIHVPLKITRDDVRALSSQLHTLIVHARRTNMTRKLAGVLRELWDHVVSPVVDILWTIHPFQSRIWWCPIAEFCVLPLHAAGAYRTGQRNLTDLYISSYTTTLAALIRARLHEPSNPGTKSKRFVAIGQVNSVRAELANIGERVKSLTTFKNIEGADSCVSRVAEELYENEWVHFACHGLPNRMEPFESAFVLHNGHFTIERIVQRELPNAEFAYLSACHTMVEDEDGPDEMIYLASAMQFAGFRSVIGTMWAVDDDQADKIASMFYDNMKDESGRLDHTRAAFALHKTMNELKGISFDQRILYVHLGV